MTLTVHKFQKATKCEDKQSRNGSQIAIETSESVTADVVQKMTDIRSFQTLVMSLLYYLLEEEYTTSAEVVKEVNQEAAANNHTAYTEEFNDTYEGEESRKDMAAPHAAHEAAENGKQIVRNASGEE